MIVVKSHIVHDYSSEPPQAAEAVTIELSVHGNRSAIGSLRDDRSECDDLLSKVL